MVDGTAGDSDRLAPGESLITYTDGLTDAMDPSDVLFGEQRLTTVLQTHHGADPFEILNQVDQAVTLHTRPAAPRMTSISSSCSIRRDEPSPEPPRVVNFLSSRNVPSS